MSVCEAVAECVQSAQHPLGSFLLLSASSSFCPPFPTRVSCWSCQHRPVHTSGTSATVFPSASSLSSFSRATLYFSTFSMKFKPVDMGGVYCSMLLPAPSSASLLQSFGGNISLIDSGLRQCSLCINHSNTSSVTTGKVCTTRKLKVILTKPSLTICM